MGKVSCTRQSQATVGCKRTDSEADPQHSTPCCFHPSVTAGEQELWSLGHRLSQRYPSIPSERYLPRRYPIVCTQESRTAASANAFASGFFPEAPDCLLSADTRPVAAQAQASALSSGSGIQEQQQAQGSTGFSAATVAATVTVTGAGANSGAATGVDSSAATGPATGADSGADSGATTGAATGAAMTSASPLSSAVSWRGDDDGSCSSAGPSARHRPRAVAINMAPMQHDPLLRFFDTCPSFVKHAKHTKAWLVSERSARLLLDSD